MEALTTVVIIVAAIIALAVLTVFVLAAINIYRAHKRMKAFSEEFDRKFRNSRYPRPF